MTTHEEIHDRIQKVTSLSATTDILDILDALNDKLATMEKRLSLVEHKMQTASEFEEEEPDTIRDGSLEHDDRGDN